MSASASTSTAAAVGHYRTVARIVCAAVLFIAAAVTLPVPLYGQYTAMSGRGTSAFGVVFASYAFGVLPALFLFGGISDRVGRRLPLQAALLLSIASIGALTLFPGLPALAFARFVQGVAIGLVGAAATAFLIETDWGEGTAERASGYVTTMLSLGLSIGAVATGICLLHGPKLLPASYLLNIAACAMTILLLARLPYQVRPRRVSLLRLPLFLPAACAFYIAVGTAWCLLGTDLSIVPVSLAQHGFGAWSGITAAGMPLGGVAIQPLARSLGPLRSIRLGLVFAPLGSVAVTLGVVAPSALLLLLGAVLVGAAGLGLTLYGVLASVSLLSDGEKARGAAGVFLFCYGGLCFAPLVVGWVSEIRGVSDALVGLTVFATLVSVGLGVGMRMAAFRAGAATASKAVRLGVDTPA